MAFNAREVFSPKYLNPTLAWKAASSSSSFELTSVRVSEKLSINISPEDRHAILLGFRVRFFTRWQSVEDFMEAAYADGFKQIDKNCWNKVLSRWEEKLEKPFELFCCLDVDDDGILSLPDVSEALAEVAPEKRIEDIQRLFRLTGVHEKKHNFDISRSDFATQCAVHLDIRPVDAEAFFDEVQKQTSQPSQTPTSQDTVPFTEIARFVEASPPLLLGPPLTGDLVLVDQDHYDSGQSVWIRYSVSQSFLGKPTLDVPGVEKGIPFPLTTRTLLRSPVIAMIPHNAKWSGGGGTGFYDPEKNIQLKTNAVAYAPLPRPKDGVVRLHAPLWTGKFKVAVFRSNGEKYFARMVGAPAEFEVYGNDPHSPDPVQHVPQLKPRKRRHLQQRLSLEFTQLDVEPTPTINAEVNTEILTNTVGTNTLGVEVAATPCQTDAAGMEAQCQTDVVGLSNNTVGTNTLGVEVVATPCQTDAAGMEAQCQTDVEGPSKAVSTITPFVDLVAAPYLTDAAGMGSECQTDDVRTATDVQTGTEGLVALCHTPSSTDPIGVPAAETQCHTEAINPGLDPTQTQ
eukprot:EG_transcript_8012